MDLQRLRSIPLFGALDEEALARIATYATESSVPAGAKLVTEGDYANEFMAIQEGEAEVLRGGQPVGTLGPGDFFGEIGVLDKSRRTATVVATTPMRLITLERWHLRRLGDTLDKLRETAEERRRIDGGTGARG